MDFETIFDEYFDKVYYKVLGIVKNSNDVEDIAQGMFILVYIKIYLNSGNESNIYTWIYRRKLLIRPMISLKTKE